MSAEASVSPEWPVKLFAVEGEIERGGAVDETAFGETEAGHQELPFLFSASVTSRAACVPKISWVWVSRSTTSQERQPPP